MKLQRDLSVQATVVRTQAHLRPSNQLAHTYHTLKLRGIWVTEDTKPVLDQNRFNYTIPFSSQRKPTLNRVRGHILKDWIDIHTK